MQSEKDAWHKDRKLTLKRPLVALDLETTGLSVTSDRIVEISCVKIYPDGSCETKTRRLNPGIPISPAATAVHGISDADVADAPSFKQVARTLLDFLQGADLTGFNVEQFDLPLLQKEFERAGITFPESAILVIDSWRIFQSREPRDLSAAYRFYCNKKLDNAHSAEADALAAAEILLAQVERYDDMPASVDELHAHCNKPDPSWVDREGKIVWQGDEAVLGFGKHKARSLRELVQKEPDYLRWMAGANFSATVITLINDALDGRYPSRVPPSASEPVLLSMAQTVHAAQLEHSMQVRSKSDAHEALDIVAHSLTPAT